MLLRRQQQSRALVSLCVGVGQGVALALERAGAVTSVDLNQPLSEGQIHGLNIRCCAS